MAKKATTSKKKSTIKVGGEIVDTSKGVAVGVKNIINKKGKNAVSTDLGRGSSVEKKVVITKVTHLPDRSRRSADAYVQRQKEKRNKK